MLICIAATFDNPYFRITAKDVELKVPKVFPNRFIPFLKIKLLPQVLYWGGNSFTTLYFRQIVALHVHRVISGLQLLLISITPLVTASLDE